MRNVLLLLFILYVSCTDKKVVTIDKSFSLNQEESINGHGEIKNLLETGRWSYRKKNRLIKQGRYKDGYKVGVWNYYIKDKVFDIDWDIYKNETISVNYPKKWVVERNQNYLFYALPKKEDKDFFLILRHNKKVVNLKLDDYLKEVFDEIIRNVKEKVIAYNLLKLKYKKRTAYFFTLTTELNQEKYTYLTFYTEDENFIYDFTFKFNSKNSHIYSNVFGGVVYGFSIEGEKLFYNNDEMISANKVNIESIK